MYSVQINFVHFTNNYRVLLCLYYRASCFTWLPLRALLMSIQRGSSQAAGEQCTCRTCRTYRGIPCTPYMHHATCCVMAHNYTCIQVSGYYGGPEGYQIVPFEVGSWLSCLAFRSRQCLSKQVVGLAAQPFEVDSAFRSRQLAQLLNLSKQAVGLAAQPFEVDSAFRSRQLA